MKQQQDPKCAQCGVVGIEKIVTRLHATQTSIAVYVVYCSECGHVYTVLR